MPESSPHNDNLKQLVEWIKEGNLERIQTALRDEPSLVNAQDERGFTPLGIVVWQGKKDQRVEMARLLIDMGAEVDIQIACSLNLADRVEALLRDDPERLRHMSPDGWSVMNRVAWHGALEAAQVLVEHGADVNMKPETSHGTPPLHGAAGDGGRAITRFLLEHGADPNAEDAYGDTALHSVIGGDQPPEAAQECLRLLLEHGADTQRMNHNGHTPLRAAVWMGARPAVDLLRERGATMYGRRPVWGPPADLAALVEGMLSEAWGGPVALGNCY